MPRVSAPVTAAILGVGLVLVVTRSPDAGVRTPEALPAELPAVQVKHAPAPGALGQILGRATPLPSAMTPNESPNRPPTIVEDPELLARFVIPTDRLSLDASTEQLDRGRFAAPGEPTLVALVASWCAPCADELPTLISFSERSEVELVLVSLDDVAGPESLKAVVEDMLARSEPMSRPLPPLTLRADPDGAWTDATQPLLVGRGDPGALPQTLLFDRDGALVALVQGPFDKEVASRIQTHLTLAEVW